ncbi:MAG: MGMT family protein [Nitriliruptoraceae bacterium]
MPSTSAFARRVQSVVASIPAGQVLTYGEVAAEAGAPGAARAVGHVLAAAGAALPWWRVVAATGRLVPGLEEEQAARLRAEGVACEQGRLARVPPTSGRA